MDESLLLSLTDDALLAVLAYLSGEELLRCRRVCRRFRQLCLHPDLWRNVQLWHDEGRNVLRAALSLAPCLGFLGCMSYSESCLPAVADTTCVVTNLSLYLSNESDFAPATAIIQKCGSLGGLRLLQLHVRFHSKECRELTMALLRAAFNIHGLQELLVFNRSNNPLLDVTGYVDVKPSLTRLVYGCLPTADPFLLLLLKTHAATLQRVELDWIDVPPVPLLAKIHGLRSLKCHPSEELSQLASLRNLESIEWLSWDNTVAVSGASDFMRQAQHLRSVKIHITCRNKEAVLRSVVESRSAGLIETLECGFYGEPPAPDIWGLCMAPALANFRSLKHLDIGDEATDVFLRAITPTSAPSLTRLEAPCPKETCTHAWLHSPAVQDVLTRNPSLHLQNNNIRDDCSCSCPWCRWGCHKALRKWQFQTYASAHSRRASCPPHCLQVAVSTCPSCGHLTSSTM